MRYLILILTLLTGCYEPPQTFEEEDMAKKYPDAARTPALGAPIVAPIIPRTGGWTGDNQLGREAKYGPDNRGTQTILKLDEWGPPEVWTVSMFLTQKFTGFAGFNITARINFGAGGSTQVVDIDWINGTQISLPMNALNVEALFEEVDVTTEGRGLTLGVQIARGARGGTRGPVKTISREVFVPAGISSGTFPIPAFARTVYAVHTGVGDLRDPAIFLRLSAGNLGAITTGQIDGDACSNGIGIPVTGQSRFVELYNGSAAPVSVNIFAEIDG